MFDSIAQTAPKVFHGEMSPSTVLPLKAPASPELSNTTDSLAVPLKKSASAGQTTEENKKDESGQITPKVLKELEQDIEALHNIGLQFSIHDKTGRTMVKIMDKVTEKLIREIPSEEVLNLSAKMEEMIGILFDKKV